MPYGLNNSNKTVLLCKYVFNWLILNVINCSFSSEILSLNRNIYSDTISLYTEILPAVSLSVISIEGLISFRIGIIRCRILFLRYLVSAFDLSSRKTIFCLFRKTEMSSRLAKSNGLIILLLTGFIPAIPVRPVPLIRFINRVSILSLRLWATAIEVYPFFILISSNHLYLRSLAAI